MYNSAEMNLCNTRREDVWEMIKIRAPHMKILFFIKKEDIQMEEISPFQNLSRVSLEEGYVISKD